jgi:hypothetical protein
MSDFTHHEDEDNEYGDDFDDDQEKSRKSSIKASEKKVTPVVIEPQSVEPVVPSSPSWLRLDSKSPKKSPMIKDSPKYFSEEEKQSKPVSYSYLEYRKGKSPKSSDYRAEDDSPNKYQSNNANEASAASSSPSYEDKKPIAAIEPASTDGYEDDFEAYEDDFQ